jgi:hypothetical protein
MTPLLAVLIIVVVKRKVMNRSRSQAGMPQQIVAE